MKTIVLHGLGQSPSSWNKVIKYLKEPNEYQLLDLFQLFESPDTSFDVVYSNLAQLLDQEDPPFNLCGHTLGGVLALRYTAAHPEKINKLITLASPHKAHHKLLKLQNFVYRLLPKSSFHGSGIEKEKMLQLSSSMEDYDLTEAVKNISCPVLIINGIRDTLNLSMADELDHLLDNSIYIIIKQAGHDLLDEQPKEVATFINRFLRL